MEDPHRGTRACLHQECHEPPGTPKADGSHPRCALDSLSRADLVSPLLFQIFLINAFDSVKSLSGDSAKIYIWEPGSTSPLFHLFGPETLGGKGNLRLKIEEMVRATGRTYAEAAIEVRI